MLAQDSQTVLAYLSEIPSEMLLPYFVAALLTTIIPARLQHFHPFARTAVPKALIKTLCSARNDPIECTRTFRTSGRAWMGNIRSKGAAEYVIFDGDRCGTLGCSYEIYQNQAGRWVTLGMLGADSDPESPSWMTNRPRFDILPTVHDGYHDLRIAVDECVKWDGGQYVPYNSDDYHHLSPLLFDSSNSNEAEIFWMIRYSGTSEFVFTPQWFPIAREEFLRLRPSYFSSMARSRTLPRIPISRLKDPVEKVWWVGLSRGGVWGIHNRRGFLLSPQQAYLGARTLQFHGDWLSIAEDLDGKNPEVEYNHRTHTLRLISPIAP